MAIDRDYIAYIISMVTPHTLAEAMGIKVYDDGPEVIGHIVQARTLTADEKEALAKWFNPLMQRSAEAATRIIPPPPYRRNRPLSERDVRRYHKRLIACRDRFAKRAWAVIRKAA